MVLEVLVEERDSQIAQLQKEIDRLTAALNSRTVISQAPQAYEPPKGTVNPQDNPINRLQERCQAEACHLPKYKFTTCREGFSAKVLALGMEATGIGRSKKDAKKDAAIALLEILG